jgi:phospholipid/cholesterol/gamma-HCH transport system substrate-binding protein
MAKRMLNNIRLGLFVLAGLFFLILTLYYLGKDKNLFGSTFILKAEFKNVNGLRAGNNIRFVGIEVGTVKKVKIISDTLVEVTMLINTSVKKFILKNAEVVIGTDGLMGNKLMNIVPVNKMADPVEEGDVLRSKKVTDTDEMIKTLSISNENIAFISTELKETVQRINKSKGLWTLMNDSTLPYTLRGSLNNIQQTTVKAKAFVDQMNTLVADIQKGNGSVGALLTDTAFSHNLNQAVIKIQEVGENASVLSEKLNNLVDTISSDLKSKDGTFYLLMKDSVFAKHISTSIENIEKASYKLDTNMEAMRHNFLLRGYFKKQEKEERKKSEQ